MRGPAASGGWASAAAVLFGVLVLVSLAVVAAERPSAPAIGGRRMLLAVAGAGGETGRTLEDFRADDPFQDSARRVPNGPDPIHNRGAGKSGRSPGRA
ncbi:CLAVATA3/ESR (CLE)-related protein 25-like [Hordeum vulgare subsp. vulgare]|uniref:CLAVATA3/ESR (CLE)-related protein 25-like n=1 Tax=Hordeum vulgare subsp. vulgare TaxID=112509 RepID=UPI000B485512|nr:CLAVATA3/ESR (CLE)-related protein 25-like [Hordeum vulgare subsp. vulgare]